MAKWILIHFFKFSKQRSYTHLNFIVLPNNLIYYQIIRVQIQIWPHSSQYNKVDMKITAMYRYNMKNV